MAARYNRPGFEDLIDFNVYALCGDGCMMEGISSEAASLAAHWKLSNLCWIYDNNHVTIEGNTALAFTEDVATRFIGLRLERHPGGRRQRPGPARPRLRRFPPGARPADPDHRRQPHRLGRAPQAGHQRRPRRAPGRGGGPAHQAQLRLARGRQVPRARRRLRALPRGHRPAAARSCATPGSAGSSGTGPSTPSWPTSSTGCNIASSPTAGTRACRPSPPTPRGWRLGTRRAWS